MDRITIITGLVVVLVGLSSCRQYDSILSAQQALRHDLSARMYRDVRPVSDASRAVPVDFGLSLLHIDDVDEAKSALSYYAQLELAWHDEFASWNPEDYRGVESIRVPVDEIWTPDIVLFNNVASELEGEVMVSISSSGNVTWTPFVRQSASCHMDIFDYPYDTHQCQLKYGSWTYHRGQISLGMSASRGQSVGVERYVTNSVWDVTFESGTINHKQYACCEEQYTDITYTIRLTRYPTYHRYLVMAPAVIFAMLMPVMFLLPYVVTDRVLLAQILCLAANMVTGGFMTSSPHTFEAPPSLGIFLLYDIVVTCLACLMSTYIIALYKRNQKQDAVPDLARSILLSGLGHVFCTDTDTYREEALQTLKNSGGSDVSTAKLSRDSDLVTSSAEWRHLAVVLDRMCFVIFSLLIIIPCFFI